MFIGKKCRVRSYDSVCFPARQSVVPFLTWAPSHLPNTSRRAASAAELAVKNKVNKYAHLLDNYIFVPFAVETLGPRSHDAKVLVSQIGQILISITAERATATKWTWGDMWRDYTRQDGPMQSRCGTPTSEREDREDHGSDGLIRLPERRGNNCRGQQRTEFCGEN
ncbi:hypothetical protein ANN_24108 [Periplaneta americana]|uniref:Uncharacterized protein n=1 Tax=Periplaneta americana TaxID=6978 RepID=A0ABQ8S255_PERAM|nr:hypothetical protein ANN_24108 [Periplaneta americana]